MNLSKVVGNFVEEQKAVNAQANQKIEAVECTLNKKIDNLQSEISKKYDNLQYSISRLTNQKQVLEKGKFPSQTQPNPRGMHELSSSSDPNCHAPDPGPTRLGDPNRSPGHETVYTISISILYWDSR